MEPQASLSPPPQLKASLKFTLTPRTDPVKSGAIFRQEASPSDTQQHHSDVQQKPPRVFNTGIEMRGESVQRPVLQGRTVLEPDPAAINDHSSLLRSEAMGGLQQSVSPVNSAQSPVADSSTIFRPSPYGRFVPQPSPTPFGVAAWASSSSVGQQISANFDALVRQSPAPRVLREHALSPARFQSPPGARGPGLQRSGGSNASQLMPPPRQSPRPPLRHSPLKQETAQFQESKSGQGVSPQLQMPGGSATATSGGVQALQSNPNSNPGLETPGLEGSPQLASAAPKVSAEIAVKNWYLIRPPRDSLQSGAAAVGVGGTLVDRESGEITWLGGPVVARIGKQQVKILSGQVVNLTGKLNGARMVEQGFGEVVNEGFEDGFPPSWQELIGWEPEGPPVEKKGSVEDGKTKGLEETPGKSLPSESRGGDAESSLLSPVKQGSLGVGSEKEPETGGKAPTPNEGPLASEIEHKAEQAESILLEPVPGASLGGSSKSPILDPGFRTPLQLQPGSVLRSHSKQKKGRSSEVSDQDVSLTPENNKAGSTPLTRSRLKAAQTPEQKPTLTDPEITPQSEKAQGRDEVTPRIPPGSSGKGQDSSAERQPRGLSAFLEDEGDDADPAFSLEFPPTEDEGPGPIAEGGLGGAASLGVQTTETGVAGEGIDALEGALERDKVAKEDSERTMSDPPNGTGPNAGPDEKGEVNSAGAASPRTPLGGGKKPSGVRKRVRKSDRKSEQGVLDGQTEAAEAISRRAGVGKGAGSVEKLPGSVRKGSHGTDAAPKSPKLDKGKMATPKPSPRDKPFGSAQKTPEVSLRVEDKSGRPSEQRQGTDSRETAGEVSGLKVDYRAERIAKRRKVSEGGLEEPREKKGEHVGKKGVDKPKADGKAEEGATVLESGSKEEAEAKRMSESRKRSRILRELESRLKGPEDEVIVTRAAKLPEAAQVSQRGRLVAPKLAYWENEYYHRDQAGRIIGISRPAERTTPSKTPPSLKPFTPKREPVVKLETAEAAIDDGQRQRATPSENPTPGKRVVKAEDDVSTPPRRKEKRKGKSRKQLLGLSPSMVVKREKAEGGGTGSPGGSPGRWVSTRGKRKREEEEEKKGPETKADGSGASGGKGKPHQSKKRRIATQSKAGKAAEPSNSTSGPKPSDSLRGRKALGSAGARKPSGSVDGSKPSGSAGSRKSVDQLWRLKRQHKVPKGPRPANFVGDGFVAGAPEMGRNESGHKADEKGEGAAQGDKNSKAKGGGAEEAKGGGAEKKGTEVKETEEKVEKAGEECSRGVEKADRRLRSANSESVREREVKGAFGGEKGGSQRKRERAEGPAKGDDADPKPEKGRERPPQGPVEDDRQRKKQKRVAELLTGDGSEKSGEAKAGRRQEAKSSSSKLGSAAGRGRAPKGKADAKGESKWSVLGRGDVSKEGQGGEGKEARYPRRRLRKRGEIDGELADKKVEIPETTEEAKVSQAREVLQEGPVEAADALALNADIGELAEGGNVFGAGGGTAEEAAEQLALGLGTGSSVDGSLEVGGERLTGGQERPSGAGNERTELEPEPLEDRGVDEGHVAEAQPGHVAEDQEEQVPEEGLRTQADPTVDGTTGPAETSVNEKEAGIHTNQEEEKDGTGVANPAPGEEETMARRNSVSELLPGSLPPETQGEPATTNEEASGIPEPIAASKNNKPAPPAQPRESEPQRAGRTAEGGAGNGRGEGPIHTKSLAAVNTCEAGLVLPEGAGPVHTGGAGPVHTNGAGPVHTLPEDEPSDPTGWTASQVAALKSALRLIDPTVEGLWYKVARQVPGKNHIECQAKHNEAYATPPVRPSHARRAGMSPPPRIILQGAGRGLAKAANPSKPRGAVTIQIQGMRAAREILRAQQAKQREEAGDPLAFQVANLDGLGVKGLGPGVGESVVSPLILKPVQNQDKYIDDALQRRLQAQRRKNATSQGGSGAVTQKVNPPGLGFEGLTREAVEGGAAGVVAAAEKARAVREQAATSMGDEPEGLAGGEEGEEEDDRAPFA